MPSRFADHILGPDTHANRPTASMVPYGALYKCSTHNLIYQNVAGTWATWASFSGYTDPTTTKGDLLTRDASVAARLAVGADGQVLTADSAQTLGVKWATPTGGGATSPFALEPASLNATYGDHFTGASLTATRAWNRQGFTSSNELFQKGASTWFQNDTSGVGSNAYYWQTAPAGDFTIVMSAIVYGNSAMFGPMILDSSGNGILSGVYSGPEAHYVLSCSAGAYSGTNANFPITTTPYVWSGAPVWYKLNKTGTNYKASISTNGQVWRPWTSTISFGTTPTRIGFGNILGTVNGFAVDFFDVQ